MTTYDMLVADELLPELLTNGNPRMPTGFRIIGRLGGPANPGCTRLRVEDANAPAWTEGKLIDPVMTVEMTDQGRTVTSRTVVTDWIEV